uniref:Uncharacterized protein n=1 Tax=Anguilla anguilla TaxID=7936 RepID=A0A0E9SBZ3_ANGAN
MNSITCRNHNVHSDVLHYSFGKPKLSYKDTQVQTHFIFL